MNAGGSTGKNLSSIPTGKKELSEEGKGPDKIFHGHCGGRESRSRLFRKLSK